MPAAINNPDSPFLVLRKELGLSRSDFAVALGCSQSWVAALESGTPRNPYIAISALIRLGIDSARLERLMKAYEAFRNQRAEITRTRLARLKAPELVTA